MRYATATTYVVSGESLCQRSSEAGIAGASTHHAPEDTQYFQDLLSILVKGPVAGYARFRLVRYEQ